MLQLRNFQEVVMRVLRISDNHHTVNFSLLCLETKSTWCPCHFHILLENAGGKLFIPIILE